MARLLSLSSALLLLPGLSSALPSAAPNAAPKPLKYIFSFGDSYTATWFNASSTLPNPSNPIGNPQYPGYTACGLVTNWIDVVTAKYNTSLVYTYNYAYGGATIDRNLVEPYTPEVKDFREQLDIYLATAATKPPSTPWTSQNSLFSIFIGINDMGGTFWREDPSAFSDNLLNIYFGYLEKMYASGGRNFLFVNVPGVDRSPMMLTQTEATRELYKTAIVNFNKKLAAKVAAFKQSHLGVKTWVYDSYARVFNILDHPTAYGLQDATSYGSAANLAWCNDFHLSSAAHEFLGKDAANILKLGGFF